MTKSSINQLYYSIGLMSGTSMDKIDGVFCETNGKDYFKLISKACFSRDLKTLI